MKLPLMVLLSIKSKSYGRLRSTHYKQVVLKDIQVLAFKYGAAGWVSARTQRTLLSSAGPSRVSHTTTFSSASVSYALLLTNKSRYLAVVVRCGVLPACNGHCCYELNPGLHICQSPHAPFTPPQYSTYALQKNLSMPEREGQHEYLTRKPAFRYSQAK